MTNNRLTRKIFNWDKTFTNEGHSTWYSEVKSIFTSNCLESSFEASTLFDLKEIVDKVQSSMLGSQQNSLKIQCEAMPKLRVFKTFKEFDTTPCYITKPMSFIQRKFISKLRLGCLEIRMETGRYARPRLPAEARLCQVCENEDQEVEDELHFLFKCRSLEDTRLTWLNSLEKPANFVNLPHNEMLGIVLNNHSNVKQTAQYIIDIFDKRSKILNNRPITNQNNDTLYHLFPHEQCPACTIVDY